jgi:hypothetical protein
MRGALTRSRGVALASVVVAVPLWAGCSSSPSGKTALAPTATCQKILAVLSDGPEPGADPVGYALSQILPLGKIHTSDQSVRATLTNLIAADRKLVSSNGKDKTATATIRKDDAALNVACPGVAP